ncbi:anchored repeat ABC transporter, substrate-binding protein [Canibacter sp. lx-45]|uniref:anchored repeat ABC transporter, substrate-binding protein n=1 Tax=Canibacter zhuwentaonis TaxID=2837491 RepID=UPI001BDD8817|nr:anchored repeat ABC transporter, substrate-binding protein [Canibacter zhuwentaonis]MBT1035225.1 anchored repeat ABC transporter, substrate-binding protein [Canibacter zhuwentaonis]
MLRRDKQLLRGAIALVVCFSLGACSQQGAAPSVNSKLRVVTSTQVLQDITRNIAGDKAEVTAVVPAGGDPQNYDPSIRDVRAISGADVALTNYEQYEDPRVNAALKTHLRAGAARVDLVEESVKHAANVIPLIEDQSLDTVWLGLASRGASKSLPHDAVTEIQVRGVKGPGRASGYITGSFGKPELFFNSADGFDEGSDYVADTVRLPVTAHTHMSWAFTEPGIYELNINARLRESAGAPPQKIGSGRLVFAVGVSPYQAVSETRETIIDAGHADITADLSIMKLRLSAEGGSNHAHSQGDSHAHDTAAKLQNAVIAVPSKTLHSVPQDEGYSFLGEPGAQVYQLPQAVLARHKHGEIDPHLLHSAHNARSYVAAIRDALIKADPQNAVTYRVNADKYSARLATLDEQITTQLAGVLELKRVLITSQNSHAYYAAAYGLQAAGYVRQSQGDDPSLKTYKQLVQTVRDSGANAVFASTQVGRDVQDAELLARQAGITACVLRDQTLDGEIQTYEALMLDNTKKIVACLNGAGG